MIDRSAIEKVVREIVGDLVRAESAITPSPARAAATRETSGVRAAQCERPAPALHELADPTAPDVIAPLVGATSSQIAVGHHGTRFKTDLYLRIREGHADAKDAVHSEIPEDWPREHGLLALQSQCRERQEYLLYPNHGRRLDEASVAALAQLRDARPDVQLIFGDGLSPLGLMKNGKQCLDELQRALASAGLRSGAPLFVKYARIGVQDEIGVLVGARATVIVVGERPGLGTGDSLSFYIAVNPKLDQDNAEKNCISNVRPIGIKPGEAADLAVKILQRAFELGGGGVAIGFGFGRT